MKKFKTNSKEETIELGTKIGNTLKGIHVVVLLDATLAMGKTTLTKGIAKGLGITDLIKSPTFTIMREYSNDFAKLYHLDLYRLNEVGLDFDLEEYVDDKNSVVVIEWPYQVSELLPEEYIKISISGELEKREFLITSTKLYEEVVNKL